MTRLTPVTWLVVIALSGNVCAEVVGWRGNWTGRYPEANPPTNWCVRPKSPAYGLRCQAGKPRPGDLGENAKPVWAGDVNEWLTLGSFNAKDAASALDEPFLPDEAGTEPAEDDKVGEIAWQRLALPHYQEGVRDPANQLRFGGNGDNRVAYAHVFLYAQTAGAACFVLNHEDGLMAWVNGKPVYKEARSCRNFSAYELDHSITGLTVPVPAPRFGSLLRRA